MPSRSTKLILVSALSWCGAALAPVPAAGQGPPEPTLRALAGVARAVRDSGAVWGPAIWPGYRPDTLPLAFAIPGMGTALFNWPGALPQGYGPVEGLPGAGWQGTAERGAASTSVELSGRAVAQMVVRDTARASLLGLTLHEALHVFQRSVAREGRRFGGGENAMLVGQYPVFDDANEAGVALEGRLLAAALNARSAAAARRLARQYAVVRERRVRALPIELVEFEELAELNEGLAQYAQIRGELLGGASLGSQDALRRLDDLTGTPGLSIRLRFYSTGSAMALLLDRLAGAGWKARLMDENLTLAELVAQVSGHHAEEAASQRAADSAFDFAALRTRARAAVTELRGQRRRVVDSLLSRPGVLVELDGSALPQRFIGHCGFDPQNTLAVGDGTFVHTRWLRVCRGTRWDGEFNTPVLQGEGFTTLRAVVGLESEFRLTLRGQPVPLDSLTRMAGAEEVRIESPGMTLRISRADLEMEGRTLRVRLSAQ